MEWIDTLKGALGESFRTTKSARMILLSGSAIRDPSRLLATCERAILRIETSVYADTPPPYFGPFVGIVFDDAGTYYSYLSHFYSDGEHSTSAGAYVNDGYGHVVVLGTPRHHVEGTLAHELCHACLSPLPLPRWVNEGCAQMAESLADSDSRMVLNRELVARQHGRWRVNGLESFWSGEAFDSPHDDEQELSYSLAVILAHTALQNDGVRFWNFVKQSRSVDAGAQAFREVFGRSLGELAGAFLGSGDWEPRGSPYYCCDNEV